MHRTASAMIREDLLWHGNGIAERGIARYGKATDMTCNDWQWQSLELLYVSEQMRSVEVRGNGNEKQSNTESEQLHVADAADQEGDAGTE